MAKVGVLVKSNTSKVKRKTLNKKTGVLDKSLLKKQKLIEKKKVWRKPIGGKGVVYLSHIPHGFYEDQIESYFKQFGKVTGVSVPRSKTGRTRGYAFIEFQHPDVAQIAADTMNNYLMFNRLLKAKYIPPKDQNPKYFLVARAARLTHNTLAEKSALAVKHNRKLKNRQLKLKLQAKQANKLLRRNKMLKEKMKKLGLDYDFEVQDGELESIFEKKKEVEERRKKIIEEALENEDLSTEDDPELSISLYGEDLSSTGDLDSSFEDNAEEKIKEVKGVKIGSNNKNNFMSNQPNRDLKKKLDNRDKKRHRHSNNVLSLKSTKPKKKTNFKVEIPSVKMVPQADKQGSTKKPHVKSKSLKKFSQSIERNKSGNIIKDSKNIQLNLYDTATLKGKKLTEKSNNTNLSQTPTSKKRKSRERSKSISLNNSANQKTCSLDKSKKTSPSISPKKSPKKPRHRSLKISISEK